MPTQGGVGYEILRFLWSGSKLSLFQICIQLPNFMGEETASKLFISMINAT